MSLQSNIKTILKNLEILLHHKDAITSFVETTGGIYPYVTEMKIEGLSCHRTKNRDVLRLRYGLCDAADLWLLENIKPVDHFDYKPFESLHESYNKCYLDCFMGRLAATFMSDRGATIYDDLFITDVHPLGAYPSCVNPINLWEITYKEMWLNPKRWEYVEHCKFHLSAILEILENEK